MLQEILTYIILIIAVGYTVYQIGRLFFASKNTGRCEGGCDCEAKKKFATETKSKETL